MILYEPVVTRQPDAVRVTSRIDTRSGEGTELWYEVPAAWEHALPDDCDAFVCGTVLLAMLLGEDIAVRGTMTSAFLERLPAYQNAFANWFPKTYRPVEVRASGPATETAPAAGEGFAFSGGVDSFYTLRSNARPDSTKVQYAVFVHGFDLPLCDTGGYRCAADAYEEALSGLKVRLVRMRTNVRTVLHSVDWEMAHGPALISIAMLLRRLFARFYIPSSATLDDDSPWGSDPRCDPLLSTPPLEIVHDSPDVHRADKLRALADWPLTWPLLRVCWEAPQGLRNCGRCFKCLSTMLALDLCGALERFSTFDRGLTTEALRAVGVPADEFYYAKTLIARLRRGGREEYASALQTALARSERYEQWNSVRRLLRRARRKAQRSIRSALP